MGLFGKEKTSTDYLKEIAKAQKEQTKAALSSGKENWTQKLEHLANSSIKDAEAAVMRAENERKQREYDLAQEEELKKKLQKFYESFDFDLNNLNEIEQKSMAIISWLDTVDRTFKDKKSKDNIDDDNKSKEQMLIRKLALAVERLRFLDKDSTRLDYIANKLSFYKNRQFEEAAKKQAFKTKVLKLSTLTLLGVGIIASLILAIFAIIPNAKKNADDCKDKVVKCINVGKLDEAYTTIIEYQGRGGEYEYKQAYILLAKELLKNDQLDKTKELRNKIYGAYDIEELIKDYMEEHYMYDDLAEYYSIGVNYYAGNEVSVYTERCIKHMCKNGKYNEARKFVKRQSIHSENPQTFIREMNVIIDSYL